MSRHAVQERLIREIQLVPESRLLELYEWVHCFRLGVQSAACVEERGDADPRTIQAIAAFRGSGKGGGTGRLLAERRADREKEA